MKAQNSGVNDQPDIWEVFLILAIFGVFDSWLETENKKPTLNRAAEGLK